MNIRGCAIALFTVAGLTACVRSKPVEPAPRANMAIVGTWRGIAYTAWDPAGAEQSPFGSLPSGYAVFDLTGHAFIQIMRPGSADTFTAYYGTYRVNSAGDSVSINVEGSNVPAYLGSVQVRPFQIRADTLVLGVQGKYEAKLVKVTGS